MSHFLREPPRRRRALATVLGVLASANLVSADDGAAAAGPAELWVQPVPLECRPFLEVPGGAQDPVVTWQHVLSLAACLTDGSVQQVDDPAQLEELVAGMFDRLELPMLIYLQALEDAPASIQLRAAFQLGMMHVALSTRARSSIAALPGAVAATAAVANRHRELHARLEPFLVHARQVAWISFVAIDRAAAQNPALASDAVARHMVRTAREMLAGLGDVAPIPSRWSLQGVRGQVAVAQGLRAGARLATRPREVDRVRCLQPPPA